METKPKKWYQTKLYVIPLGILAVAILAGASSNHTSSTPVQQKATYNRYNITTTVTYENQSGSNLSNDNTYINTYGNTVHSPAYSTDRSIPAGASAQCRDGTYSFSQSRRGTCSRHGGVSRWL